MKLVPAETPPNSADEKLQLVVPEGFVFTTLPTVNTTESEVLMVATVSV